MQRSHLGRLMNLWIRIDANIGRNPTVWKMADVRGLSAVEIVGHLVMLFGNVAEHAPHGDVSSVSDRLIEEWAGWHGEPGAFASSFRELFVSDGVIDGWEKRQGKLIERAAKERERAARRRSADSTPKVREQSADASAARNGTERSTSPNGEGEREAPRTIRIKKPRAPRPPAPWMGRLNRTWKAVMGGDMPLGSATLLTPVVGDIGEDETDARLVRFLAEADLAFATVKTFCSKHGLYADDGGRLAVDPTTGLPNDIGVRALGGRR